MGFFNFSATDFRMEIPFSEKLRKEQVGRKRILHGTSQMKQLMFLCILKMMFNDLGVLSQRKCFLSL